MGLFGPDKPDFTGGLIEGCYTLTDVPGKRITKSFGLIEYVERSIDADALERIDKIFDGLVDIARKVGANAVINARLTTGTYQPLVPVNFRTNITTYVIAYGEAVVLELIAG